MTTWFKKDSITPDLLMFWTALLKLKRTTYKIERSMLKLHILPSFNQGDKETWLKTGNYWLPPKTTKGPGEETMWTIKYLWFKKKLKGSFFKTRKLFEHCSDVDKSLWEIVFQKVSKKGLEKTPSWKFVSHSPIPSYPIPTYPKLKLNLIFPHMWIRTYSS